MTVHVSGLRLALHPLIAEAKRRMRRRRLTLLALLALVGLGVAVTYVLRPPPGPPAPAAQQPTPRAQLIVPNRSIGPFSLGESRAQIEKSFGPGTLVHGWISYFGGRVLLDYVYKVGPPTKHVQAIRTTWDGYRTPSGVHVGSSLPDVRHLLHAACGGPNEACNAGHGPGGPGTMLWMRSGHVAWIQLWFVS